MFVQRKSLTAAMCLAACLVAFPVPQAMAAAPYVGDSYTEIMPMMEYIYDADYDFAISNGKAIMSATVSGHSATATKCEIKVELQKKGLLFWDTIETWTATESNRRAELDVSYKVTTGEKYRMVTTVTVWSGTASETKTMTSSVLEA